MNNTCILVKKLNRTVKYLNKLDSARNESEKEKIKNKLTRYLDSLVCNNLITYWRLCAKEKESYIDLYETSQFDSFCRINKDGVINFEEAMNNIDMLEVVSHIAPKNDLDQLKIGDLYITKLRNSDTFYHDDCDITRIKKVLDIGKTEYTSGKKEYKVIYTYLYSYYNKNATYTEKLDYNDIFIFKNLVEDLCNLYESDVNSELEMKIKYAKDSANKRIKAHRKRVEADYDKLIKNNKI